MKKQRYFVSYNHTSKNKNGFGNAVITMKKHFDYNEIQKYQEALEKKHNVEGVIIINIIKM